MKWTEMNNICFKEKKKGYLTFWKVGFKHRGRFPKKFRLLKMEVFSEILKNAAASAWMLGCHTPSQTGRLALAVVSVRRVPAILPNWINAALFLHAAIFECCTLPAAFGLPEVWCRTCAGRGGRADGRQGWPFDKMALQSVISSQKRSVVGYFREVRVLAVSLILLGRLKV